MRSSHPPTPNDRASCRRAAHYLSSRVVTAAGFPDQGQHLLPAARGAFEPRGQSALSNKRMKLACRSGHVWWNESFLIVAAPARSLCAIR
jgi:hypothetical protein